MAISSKALARLAVLIVALMAVRADAVRPREEPVAGFEAAALGRFIEAPSGRGEAEVVSLDARVAPVLAALAPEESVRIDEWPVAPGVRRSVRLTRHEVYAPGARIFRVQGTRVTDVAHSRLVFFWGGDVEGDRIRLMVSVDPVSGELKALSRMAGGFHELVPGGNVRPGQHLLARAEDFLDEPPSWSCGQEDSPETTIDRSERRAAAGRAPSLITSLHKATIGFDTDNELMSQKFADDTTAASNYIASLVASINVMYERDLLLRLLQGTTFLRVSTVADPYSQNCGGNACIGALNEFGNYWSTNYGGVSRALAAMLSGKQTDSNSASGIAWIGGLCSPFSGYSFSQVFKINYLSGDTLIVGHEIGHNLSSPHTHCYSNTPLPAPDHCWAGEACYGGPTSCPAPQTINGVTSVTGTIMSYCHLLGGCSTSLVFHPRTVNEYAGPVIQGAVGTCVFPVSTAPTVTGITPDFGSTLGGTPVTITGTQFVAGATVSIGGVAATGVSFLNATTLTAATGAHTTATVGVTITNPDTQTGSIGNGYFYAPPPSTTQFHTLPPCRVLDTRNPAGQYGGPALAGNGGRRTFVLANQCLVPLAAKAVSVNITVTQPAAAGSLTLYPGNGIPTGTTSINFKAGQTRANNAMLYLSTDGLASFGVENDAVGTVHFILDVNGYFQ